MNGFPPSNTLVQMFFSNGRPVGGPLMFWPVNGDGDHFLVMDADGITPRYKSHVRFSDRGDGGSSGFRLVEKGKPDHRALNQPLWSWKAVHVTS